VFGLVCATPGEPRFLGARGTARPAPAGPRPNEPGGRAGERAEPGPADDDGSHDDYGKSDSNGNGKGNGNNNRYSLHRHQVGSIG
jgi:hypothetical protein